MASRYLGQDPKEIRTFNSGLYMVLVFPREPRDSSRSRKQAAHAPVHWYQERSRPPAIVKIQSPTDEQYSPDDRHEVAQDWIVAFPALTHNIQKQAADGN